MRGVDLRLHLLELDSCLGRPPQVKQAQVQSKTEEEQLYCPPGPLGAFKRP